MLILTHDTLRNPAILKVRQLPRKFFGRVTPHLKEPQSFKRRLRRLVEYQVVRYILALSPLVAIGAAWNVMALPLAQAPVLMIIMIWGVEMRLLRVPATRRAALIDGAEADRGLDLLKVQARDVLTRIAAGRDMRVGQLHLVVEQSELWRLAPLTYVSVQSDDGPEVLRLTAEERAIIKERLFQGALSEVVLQRINQSQNTFLRDIVFDTKGVSAHARLTAALA